MFKFIRLGQDNFRVICSHVGVDCSGPLDEMQVVMDALGVPADEMNRALEEMKTRETNCADFGIGLSGDPQFIYSERLDASALTRIAA